jgi:hypothetical protein
MQFANHVVETGQKPAVQTGWSKSSGKPNCIICRNLKYFLQMNLSKNSNFKMLQDLNPQNITKVIDGAGVGL